MYDQESMGPDYKNVRQSLMNQNGSTWRPHTSAFVTVDMNYKDRYIHACML